VFAISKREQKKKKKEMACSPFERESIKKIKKYGMFAI